MTNTSREAVERLLDGVTPGPWTAEWAACRADREDIEYERERKLKKGEVRRVLKVGDVLWRVPTSLGPISVDHNHWTGSHIAVSEEDAAFVCAARELVPALLARAEAAEARMETAEELGRALEEDAGQLREKLDVAVCVIEDAIEALEYSASQIENLENTISDYRGNFGMADNAAKYARAALAQIKGG